MNDHTALTIISSDGHAGAHMADYKPYLEEKFHQEFDDFLVEWSVHGSRNFDRPALERRLDPEFISEWEEKLVETGRIDGFPDPVHRLVQMDQEGITAEVLFPDFGLPFELYSRGLASALNYPSPDAEHKRAGMLAFNRWLADFVATEPLRFAGMALICWQQEIEQTLAEIRWAHAAGLKGIVLPEFDPEMPLYHPNFEPIWNTLEELGMIVNSHSGISSTSNHAIYTPGVPHAACASRIWLPEMLFYCHNVLSHLIWGGVLERHPDLRAVFTEQGSYWTVPALRSMDYAYDGSYYRTDYKHIIRSKPSEYFERQCFIGSSIFSKAEIDARHEIGVGKMLIGMDFPHHEGTLLETTKEYLRATFGAANVPPDEASLMLGRNAAGVFGFDLGVLDQVARKVGPSPRDILTPPEGDLFPRGDVHKPADLVL